MTVVEHGGTAGCGEPAAVVELSAIQKHPGFDSQFYYIFVYTKITMGSSRKLEKREKIFETPLDGDL